MTATTIIAANTQPDAAQASSPGPWTVDYIDRYLVRASDGRTIASTSPSRGQATREDEANARLIAAAPELLAACQHAAMSIHHPACKAHGDFSGNPEIYCTCHVQKARAVITRATVASPEVMPLDFGTQIRTLAGECDEDEGRPRSCPPGEVGTIDRVRISRDGPYYSVVFEPSGVWVWLYHAEVTDPTKYAIITA